MATLAAGSNNGDRLSEVLLREGLLTREQLASAMAEVLALDNTQIEAKRRANVARIQRDFDLDESQRRILELMEL